MCGELNLSKDETEERRGVGVSLSPQLCPFSPGSSPPAPHTLWPPEALDFLILKDLEEEEKPALDECAGPKEKETLRTARPVSWREA